MLLRFSRDNGPNLLQHPDRRCRRQRLRVRGPVVFFARHLLGFGAYPFHTHSMACGRNCALALRTPWPEFWQNRYW
jgi:hypothetical protein